MARYSGKKQVSEETRSEAMKLARGTQVPGQTKAQTTLIAQGIERGIDLYKKQQKQKARAQDRRQRELRRQAAPDTGRHDPAEPAPASAPGRARFARLLPWLLLALTWTGIAVAWALGVVGR